MESLHRSSQIQRPRQIGQYRSSEIPAIAADSGWAVNLARGCSQSATTSALTTLVTLLEQANRALIPIQSFVGRHNLKLLPAHIVIPP